MMKVTHLQMTFKEKVPQFGQHSPSMVLFAPARAPEQYWDWVGGSKRFGLLMPGGQKRGLLSTRKDMLRRRMRGSIRGRGLALQNSPLR
jgi:hypothetical protein